MGYLAPCLSLERWADLRGQRVISHFFPDAYSLAKQSPNRFFFFNDGAASDAPSIFTLR